MSDSQILADTGETVGGWRNTFSESNIKRFSRQSVTFASFEDMILKKPNVLEVVVTICLDTSGSSQIIYLLGSKGERLLCRNLELERCNVIW